jgi:hypothetical protein
MPLSAFQTTLCALLHDHQQNAIADILIQIKNAPYRYDKVLYESVQNSMSPLGLSLMAAQIVQSTKTLIGSLAEQQESDVFSASDNEQASSEPLRQAADLKNRIAAGKTKQALDEFSAIIGSKHELANDLLLLQSRYNSNETAYRKMAITDEVHRMEQNKIGMALLYYIDDFFK